jgi:PAS domain S-box-containing protein
MNEETFNVLLIDDNPGDARLIQEMLVEGGRGLFNLAHTDRLSTGLEHLSRGGVDGLLLDLGLPPSQGLDTLREVLAKATLLPAIVVLTGLDDETLAVQAVREGAQDYLVKGRVDGEVLGRTLRHAIERKRAEERIEHLNRVLRAIRDVNQLITEERDRGRLLQGVCDTLIETRGYHSAWIVLMEDVEGIVTAVEAGAGDTLSPLIDRLTRGEWVDCGRRALSQRGPVITHHPPSACGDCPLTGCYGRDAAMTIRMEHGGRIYGLLSVSIPASLAGEEEEQALFEEVAGDIAFALRSIEQERERARAERALRTSEARYRTLFESSLDGIAESDMDGRILDCNQAYLDLTGHTLEEMKQLRYQDLTPERWREVDEAQVRQALERGHSDIYEKERIRKDGTLIPISIRIWAHKDERGRPMGLWGIVRDITEQKAAEERTDRLLTRTREQAHRLQQTIDTVPEGVLLLDADHRVILGNPVAEGDLEVLAQAQVDDVLTRLGDHALEQLLAPPPSGKAWHEVKANGRTFEVIARPMHADQGAADGEAGVRERWVMVINDVTEERDVQEQLRQQERLAAIGRLAGGIAHDFNNLLATIILYAQMPLGKPDLAPDVKHAAETILEESHRAADLVQQILDFSRSAMMETEPVGLGVLVRETATLLRRTIPEHVRLVTKIGSRPCVVQADPTRIHQVLMNLALNAKDAMPKGGELRIGVARVVVTREARPPLSGLVPGAWARLIVSDTGTGMTEEAQEHLFEPFFTTKEAGRGTGLGLAQVYGIVKQHQGFIDVETAEGVGTTVTIFLPLVAEPEDGGPAKRTGAPVEGQGETVLVVEDAEQLRQAIQAGLASVGYRVLTAAHGRQALEILSREQVDLVLTDVVMPQMGGEALLRELQARAPDLKVVAITGHVMDTDLQGLQRAGFNAALSKPFSIEELSEVIGGQLSVSRPTPSDGTERT